MNGTFLQERIDATKALIVAHEEAALALAAGTIASYSLDTGQSRQSVTKHNLATLNAAIDGLYNRLATLEARQGGGATNMGPAW